MSQAVPLPSDRSFGFLFVIVFALLSAVALWRGWSWSPWFAAASALTLVVSLTRPALLRPLNRQWMLLAELLNRVVSPVVLGVIYFCLFAPVAAGMRLFGRDSLKRRFDPAIPSYWIERAPPGPDPKSLPNQF